jgi:RNA polymerase sigma factor (sigma-70 family)
MLGIKRFSDTQLVNELQNGNEEALVSMYREYYTLVRNFIMKNNGDEEEIDDILQDSLIAIWQNVNKKDFTLTVKMSTYLLSIVKNLWFKRLKKKSRFTVVEEGVQDRLISEEPKTAGMDHGIIRDMVAALDETCKQLLGYFYFDQLENKVIAEKMGFANTDTVKSKKYQCFKKLETMVKERYSKEDFF